MLLPDACIWYSRGMSDELKRVIERAKQEIIEDAKEGCIPRDAASFSKLHDYVDANGYGGAFEDDAHDVEDVAFWNEVQAGVDSWLQAGGLRAALEVKNAR